MSTTNVTNPRPRRTKVKGERGVYYRDTRDGRRYEITFTDPATGKQRWLVVPGDLKAACAARGKKLDMISRGESVAKPSKLTLAEVGEAWLTSKTKLRSATVAWYTHARDAYIVPELGRRKVATITVDDVAQLVASMESKGYASWTIRGTLTVLGGILGYAVRRGHAPTNAVRQLERDERPANSERESRILDANEIPMFLTATPPLYRPMIATAIFTGLRQGELLGLKWADVDFEAGVVRVRHQLDRRGILTVPKTRQSLREVVLMPSLGRLLREHRIASRYSTDDDFVFASLTGGPMHYRNVVRRGFEKAAQAAGVNHITGAKLVFHDLRRTFGSLLIAQGCDIVFVSRQMGHSSVAVTLTVYAKLFDGERHACETSARLEAAFGGILL